MSHRKKTLMFRLSIFVFTLVSCAYMLPILDSEYSYFSATTSFNEQIFEINILHRVLDPIVWTLITLILLVNFMESGHHPLLSAVSIPLVGVVAWLLYFVSPYPAVEYLLRGANHIPTVFYYLGIGLGVLFLGISVVFFLRRGLLSVKTKRDPA
jgi:hypothetical protein